MPFNRPVVKSDQQAAGAAFATAGAVVKPDQQAAGAVVKPDQQEEQDALGAVVKSRAAGAVV
jgi:hypothetical protein